jgi:hypothetical protein
MEERIASGLYSLFELHVDRARLNLGNVVRPRQRLGDGVISQEKSTPVSTLYNRNETMSLR